MYPKKRNAGLQWGIALLGIVCLCLAGYILMGKTVTITVDDQTQKIHTFKMTVEEVIKEAGIELVPEDKVTPQLQTYLTEGMAIKIQKAFPIKIIADGKERTFISIPITVREALSLNRVSLGPSDIVSADLDSQTHRDQIIRVTRVTEQTVRLNSPIPYIRSYINDDTLEKGLWRTVVRGHKGVIQEVIRITYHDGKEVKREPLSSKVLKEPVNEVVAMGTITSVSRGGIRMEIERALMVTATAYTYTGRRTALGETPAVGIVSTDPKVIPMGTRLYIEGYGFARAGDRGSSIKGNRIDVFLETVSECKRWGQRTIKVYILK